VGDGVFGRRFASHSARLYRGAHDKRWQSARDEEAKERTYARPEERDDKEV